MLCPKRKSKRARKMLTLSKRKPNISENPLFPGKNVINLMTMRNQLAIDDQPTEDELQARTVIAENIPANYQLEDLEKLFCYLGSVKSFRVRNPQDPNLAGCSRDVLTIKESFWNSERTLSGLHAIVEYGTESAAYRTIRYFDQYPHQKGGFRVRSRRDYSLASEKDQWTRSDMDSDMRGEMRNSRKRRGLTEKSPLRKKYGGFWYGRGTKGYRWFN